MIGLLVLALVLAAPLAWWGAGRLDDHEDRLGGHWLNGDERW